LRKSTEKMEQGQKEFGIALENAQAAVAAAQTVQPVAMVPSGGQVAKSGRRVEVKLRMGWRNDEEVNWSAEESTHVLPFAFGRNPGPSGMVGMELILLDENPPHRLDPLQFQINAQGGSVVLKDELSTHGNEVSGVSVGPGFGVTEIDLPAGQHVLIAGGEGSPYVMVLDVPELG